MSEHRDHSAPQPDKSYSSELSTRNPSVDWAERLGFPKRFLNTAERFSLALEKPICRWVRTPNFNPLYHTGTITILLMFVILGTGVYLTMFYQFGFEASYTAVSNIESNLIGRIVRAVHRYASGAAVIFALLHGWRTFFQDRFRGPRWLAWVSGVLMSALVLLIGISGYWMIWDQRAQLINQTLINFINSSQAGTNFLVRYLVTDAAGTGWVFILLVTTIHLGLSAVVGFFYWLHIKRLSRAKWLPPTYWMVAIVGLLVVASALIPVGVLAPIDPTQLPSSTSTDLFFLFYLPAGLNWNPLTLWACVIILVTLISAIPWILVQNKWPPIVVHADRCTGCTLCANDCPYKAIKMVERQDGARHKFLAKIDPKMCVSCGICIGTCTPLAMTFADRPAASLWKETLSRISDGNSEGVKVVFTCERHAYQGAKSHLRAFAVPREKGGPLVQVVPLTCVGMAHPNLATQTLEAGAREVHFIGCPPEDCANREGNLSMQERLDRERLPKLNQKFKDALIYYDWLPPNDFRLALEKPNQQREATSYHFEFSQIKWRNFIPAVVLLMIIFAVQIWLSDRPYQPYSTDMALLELALNHKAGYPLKGVTNNLEPELGVLHPTRLIIEIDGNTHLDHSYPPQGRDSASLAFEQLTLAPGDHDIQVTIFDRPDQIEGQILLNERISFENRGILKLSYRDAQISGDPAAGRDIFFESSLGSSASCHICHAIEPGVDKVGPSLAGVGTRAIQRKPGMSAEAYLQESIRDPDAYIVEGYFPGIMLPDLDKMLSDEQIENLVAFLLTMK